MKAERTIRDALRAINRIRRAYEHGPIIDVRADDQAYGASEALRWVLGEGPSPVALAAPLEARTDD